jgi:hypothetical protein
MYFDILGTFRLQLAIYFKGTIYSIVLSCHIQNVLFGALPGIIFLNYLSLQFLARDFYPQKD